MFRIESTFAAQYDVTSDPSGPGWESQFYGTYANSSTVLHVWPYIREFCSSTTARMGLSPVFLDTMLVAGPSFSCLRDPQVA